MIEKAQRKVYRQRKPIMAKTKYPLHHMVTPQGAAENLARSRHRHPPIPPAASHPECVHPSFPEIVIKMMPTKIMAGVPCQMIKPQNGTAAAILIVSGSHAAVTGKAKSIRLVQARALAERAAA